MSTIMAPYDPRIVANLLLDLADSADGAPIEISNLALQKLLYFAHAHYLVRTGAPLVSGAFEAWTHGPVHPAVYHSFKQEGRRPIRGRAVGRNLMSGEVHSLPSLNDALVRRHLQDVLRGYGGLTAGQLEKLSHAPKGAWATVVNKAKTSVALGLRIPDSVTLSCFKYHKVTVESEDHYAGERYEDAPLVGN